VVALAPNTAEVGSAEVQMVVTGTGFSPQTVVLFNGGPEPTDYTSPTEVTTFVQPATASGPATVPVGVQNGNLLSNTQDFTFTAPP
jgi:IPT/TIG domain